MDAVNGLLGLFGVVGRIVYSSEMAKNCPKREIMINKNIVQTS